MKAGWADTRRVENREIVYWYFQLELVEIHFTDN